MSVLAWYLGGDHQLPLEERHRANLAIRFSLVGAVIASFYAVFYLVVSDYAPGAVFMAGVTIGMVLVPVVVRIRRSTALAAHLIGLIVTATSWYLATLRPGLAVSALMYSALVPVVVYNLAGGRAAWAWAAIDSLGAGAFGLAALAGLTRMAFPMQVNDTLIIDATGVVGLILAFVTVAGVLESSRNSTERERKTLELAMHQSRRLEGVGMLAAGVAHEINNPLSFVLANVKYLEEVLGERGTDEELREIAQDAHEGARRVQSIVKALTTLAMPQSDDLGPVHVAGIVENALHLTHNLIKYRAGVLREVGADLVVLADEGQLSQVLVNLLTNAGEAFAEGSAEGNTVTVSACASGDEVLIRVADTGRGMSLEHQEQAFDPFFTTKDVGAGMGLGLSIARQLVSQMGGRMAVQSELGAGSTFSVWLPAAHTEVSDIAARDPLPEASADPVPDATVTRRILVVDDERALCKALRRLLSPRYEVVTCYSGTEARLLLERDDTYDVVLCDLMMPGMTGMQLHGHVAAERPALAGRFLFITGGAVSAEGREFLVAHTERVLTKPIDPEVLERSLSALLDHDPA